MTWGSLDQTGSLERRSDFRRRHRTKELEGLPMEDYRTTTEHVYVADHLLMVSVVSVHTRKGGSRPAL